MTTHEQCMKYNFVAPLKVPCTFFERNYQTKQRLVSNNGNDGKTIFENILINWMFFEVVEFKFKSYERLRIVKICFSGSHKRCFRIANIINLVNFGFCNWR